MLAWLPSQSEYFQNTEVMENGSTTLLREGAHLVTCLPYVGPHKGIKIITGPLDTF